MAELSKPRPVLGIRQFVVILHLKLSHGGTSYDISVIDIFLHRGEARLKNFWTPID